MSTNINSTEQIVEINAGDQITNVNIVSQSTTQVISGEQVVTVDVNAGTIPAAWGSITGTLSNQTDLQNALNAKQNNITLTTTGSTGVATLVGSTLNIPNYVSSTKQTQWDSAYNDKINSAEVSGTTTKTLTLTQQDGGIIQASWSDFDTAPVTSVFGRTGDIVAAEGDYNINQLGDVTITSATNGQVLKYNGTAWVNAADASGLTSVGLAMPSAFTVSGSPLTSNGTITVTGAGTTSQYVRGDGSLATFPTTSNEAKTLIREVYNKTGATLTKGTVIYINGGQGNLPTVTKAIATGDPTSAQTFGIVQSDITNMNNGFVVVAGGIDNIDTQAYTEGTAIYLSPTTAGAWTSTKPYAPDHMVYLGVVVRSHPTQGVIEVKIQNGVEIDEIHNVSARFPTNKDGLFYNSTSNVWENKSIAGVLGYTPVPQSRIITINGTAQDLSADRTYNVGTVTSIAASGGTGISISGSPVTGSGTISITNTAPDQTVTITPSGLATVSGTYPNFTVGVSTAYSGSVTSVNASVPTGFEVSGVPITTAGTIDIKFASGYSLPTTAKQTQWDDAYTKRINSLTVTGNSGSSTLVSNVLNVPTYTLSGLGGEPAITSGTSLQYWRGDKTFQTLNTGVVPESGNVYFTEPRVRATVLSGLNITGGSISASDSVLDAFGKVQNQINGLIGGSIFQSTWNASTNSPTLTSSVGTKGYYYIVSVAGTTNLNGITDWQIGDWAIFDGTVWRKVDNTDAVVSVNGFTGTVSLGISNLADVSASSPTDTQLLRFNGTTSKWYNWTPTYISGNQTITLSGDVTGSGTTAITTSIGAGKVTNAMLAGSINYAKMDSATVPTWNQDTTGNAATADKWKTARTLTIGATGKSVDGSGNVSWSLAEIGAQAALTNPITGDGIETSGNIAYFNGNTSIIGGTDLFYDSGNGRLRINSTAWQSTGAGTKLQVGNVLSNGTGAIAQFNGFLRIRDSLIIHNDSDPTKDVIALVAVDQNVVSVGGSVGANLLVNTLTNNGENLYVKGNGQFTTTLGVGTGVSNAILSVKGDWVSGHSTIKIFPTTSFASGGLAGIGIFDSNGSTRKAYIAATPNDFQIIGEANVPTTFYTANTLALTLSTTQNALFAGTISATGGTLTGALTGTTATFLKNTAGTNDKEIVLFLQRGTTGTAAAGLGGHIEFASEDDAGTQRQAALISWDLSDVSNAAPKGRLYLGTRGSTTAITIANDGATTFASSVTATIAALGSASDRFVVSNSGTLNYRTAAQVLSDIGAQAALSNPITGDGSETAGNVAYFTGNTTIAGESDFFYDADNNRLRINSNAWGSTAETKLQVGGVLTSGSSAIAQLNGFVRIKDQLIIHQNADTTKQGIIQTIDNNVISINPTGGTLLVNTNTSTAANYKFQVAGDMIVRDGGDIVITPATSGANATLYNDIGNLIINNTTSINGSMRLGSTSAPDNSTLQVVGDWVSGHSTVKIQGSASNQTGLAMYNTAGARRFTIAYTGTYGYLETENSTTPIYVSPNGTTRAEFNGDGTIGIGGGTTGVTQRDIHIIPTSASPAIYLGRLSSTSADSTKVYFQDRVGTTVMLVDTFNQRIGIGTATPTSVSNFGLEIFENTNGGSLTLSRDAGNQRGVIRFGRNNGGSFQLAARVTADSTAGGGTNGGLYFETTNGSGNAQYNLAMIGSSGRVVVGNSLIANGVLQVTGSHVSGYGLINMNSTDSCIIALDSSGSYDVRMRLKYQGSDKWYVGMATSDKWELQTSGSLSAIIANQSGDVTMPYRVQVASTGGFATSSAKLLVGDIMISGSGAILQVNGFSRMRDQIILQNNTTLTNESYIQCTANAELTTGGSLKATSFFETSDIRLKSNIQDYKSNDILNITAKIYEKDGKLEVGYIAQELQDILGSAISVRENGYLDLSYRQVHTAKIAALEAKIKELEAKLK